MPDFRGGGDNQIMDNENASPLADNPVIKKPKTLEEKLRLIDEMRGCAAGYPSGSDMLLEDRLIERERELADGW